MDSANVDVRLCCFHVRWTCCLHSSRKLNVIADSSALAEYSAASACCKELTFVRHLLGELHFALPGPVTLAVDNSADSHKLLCACMHSHKLALSCHAHGVCILDSSMLWRLASAGKLLLECEHGILNEVNKDMV